MASFLGIERCNNFIPLSVNSPSSRPHLPSLSRKTLTLPPRFPKLNLQDRLFLNGSTPALPPVYTSRIPAKCHVVAKAAESGDSEEQSVTEVVQQKGSQLQKRIVFGVAIGIAGGGVILVGGWVFTVAVAAAVFDCAREYFGLVRSVA